MRCPKCNKFFTLILASDPVDNITKHKRSYKCLECSTEFFTIEIKVEDYRDLLKQQFENKK